MAMTELALSRVKTSDWERIENTVPEKEKHWSWDEDARKAVVTEKRRIRWGKWKEKREKILATL